MSAEVCRVTSVFDGGSLLWIVRSDKEMFFVYWFSHVLQGRILVLLQPVSDNGCDAAVNISHHHVQCMWRWERLAADWVLCC